MKYISNIRRLGEEVIFAYPVLHRATALSVCLSIALGRGPRKAIKICTPFDKQIPVPI